MAVSNGGIIGKDNDPVYSGTVIESFTSSGNYTVNNPSTPVSYLCVAGGGGGGSATYPGNTNSSLGGNGGSGLVIIRYKYQ